jgi:hypothetical protein
MDTEIKASHEKAKNSYGQNGSPQSSSLLPGEKKNSIADVSPQQTAVPGLRVEDTLPHRVKMDGEKAAAYPAHDGLVARGVDSGSPGGVIGSKTNHSPKR